LSSSILAENLEIKINKSVIYGCETWSFTLREEHRFRVFQNRVLRIFVPEKEEVAGGWKRLHNEELQNFMILQILFG
jgi:hypothetical protein